MEWKEVRLGDVVEIVNGFAFKSKAFTLEGIPVIKIKNIKAGKVILNDLDYISTSDINPKYTKIRSSDILITMTGNRMDGSPETWVGKVSLFRHQGDFYLNQRVSALRLIDDSVDNNFLSYYLSSWQSQLYFALNSNSSGGQANITPAVVQEYRLMVPELETQRSIASILSSLDRKIELNNKINADLEEMAQAIFKNWFVDFEPFKDGKFVDSELGLIPEGWKVGRADDFYQINIGKTPPRKEHKWFSTNPADKIWVSIANMGNSGIFISDSSEYLTKEAVDSYNIIMVPRNTILLSFKLTVGRVAIADKELTTNEAIARFILSDDKYMEYLYLYLKNFDYNSLGSTSSIATAVNSKTIKGMQMLQPSDKIIDAFHIQVNPIFEKIRSLTKENSRLSLLRDTLLPRLMSGELEVPE